MTRSQPPSILSARVGRKPARGLRHILPAATLTVTLVVVLAGCGAGSTSTPASVTPAHPPSAATIAITNFMFLPAHLTVAPGATITVDNRDNVAHTVTSRSGMFDTRDIAAGTSVTFTAPSRAGNYSYICSIHQYMTGTLTVA